MPQLTLADEIVVLMLDDEVGEIRKSCMPIARVAIADSAKHEWSMSTVTGPLRRIDWLDRPTAHQPGDPVTPTMEAAE